MEPAPLAPDPTWTRALGLLGAALSLGFALQAGDGQLRPWALAWMLLGLVLALITVGVRPAQWIEKHGEAITRIALAVAFALEILLLSRRTPGIYLDDPSSWRTFFPLACLGAALVLLGSFIARPRSVLRHAVLPGLLLLQVALGLWLIHASPHPHIDVHLFQQEASAALLHGRNPYSMTFPDIYAAEEGASARLYGVGLSADGRLAFGFPYPPLTLLLGLPGALLGDHRYAQLAAMTLSGALIGFSRPGWFPKAAAAVYLFFPRTLFVLEQGWTEPFGVLLVALVAFCALRLPKLTPVAFGLLIASKQYLAFAVPLAVLLFPGSLSSRQKLRVGAEIVATAALVTAPLALWDLASYWKDVVTLQFHQPFRQDALSVLAAWSRQTGMTTLAAWPAWVALAAGLAWCLWKAPRTPSGFALAVAATFFAFFAFNKQAFCNYYYFVAGALCVALSTAVGTPDSPAVTAVQRLRSSSS